MEDPRLTAEGNPQPIQGADFREGRTFMLREFEGCSFKCREDIVLKRKSNCDISMSLRCSKNCFFKFDAAKFDSEGRNN